KLLRVRRARLDESAPPVPLFIARRPPPSSFFPYTTLFRSRPRVRARRRQRPQRRDHAGPGVRPPSAAVHHARGVHRRPLPLRRRSEEHTSELQSRFDLVCRLLLETKKMATDEHSSDSTLPG